MCQGYRIAVDMDLSKFFDRVNHDVLMHRVARKIRDKRILRLIGKYLRAGVVIKGRLQKTREGVPQGGPLTP
jgi:RNA-directed DNA polymerase